MHTEMLESPSIGEGTWDALSWLKDQKGAGELDGGGSHRHPNSPHPFELASMADGADIHLGDAVSGTNSGHDTRGGGGRLGVRHTTMLIRLSTVVALRLRNIRPH